MIRRIRGTVVEKVPPYLTVDVSGVGFWIQAPLPTFDQIKENQEITLYTQCIFKEDEAFVYGFLNINELETFQDLISVSGVGPKSALHLMSRFSPEEISQAIDDENCELLSSVPKIGKKVASKIVLELKGKLKFAAETSTFSRAVDALCSLGLTRAEAIERLKKLPKDLSVEALVRQALRK
jgi:Holliday junction DNA helicase RuvA